MIPLEAALDQQNHPEKYAQQEQEKLEKELTNSGATVEREKWLKHPCTQELIRELEWQRTCRIDNAERGNSPLNIAETSTLRKVVICIKQNYYPDLIP